VVGQGGAKGGARKGGGGGQNTQYHWFELPWLPVSGVPVCSHAMETAAPLASDCTTALVASEVAWTCSVLPAATTTVPDTAEDVALPPAMDASKLAHSSDLIRSFLAALSVRLPSGPGRGQSSTLHDRNRRGIVLINVYVAHL
jgi:hypothetical protein